MEFKHKPVLLNECIEGLNIKPDGIYVDGTLGGAGHSSEIVKRIASGKLIGIDQDAVAIETAKERLRIYGDKVILVHDNFRNLDNILDSLGIDKIDGMLVDLGVSSPQLDDGSRGFSYTTDAPLDMRMNKETSVGAYEVVNFWEESELKRILFDYGEEKFAPRIAKEIVKRREIKPIKTTFELVNIIKSAMPASALREKQHPAKRSFQAIRIAVNDEFGAESELLNEVIPRLKSGGRLAVISFHSLEDRIVKNAITARTKGCTCPPDFPVCVCGFKPTIKVITKKPITASKEELEENPRARSAKLRVVEKL